MKIGFHLPGDGTWNTGTVYLETLLHSLKDFYPTGVSLCVAGNDNQVIGRSDLINIADRIIIDADIKSWTGPWLIHSLGTRLFRRDFIRDRLLRQQGVDVIAFAESPLGSSIPSLGWIPDYQHSHYPLFFSEEERLERNRHYATIAERSSRVVLLSKAVKRDFDEFAPKFAGKARVISPVSFIPTSIYSCSPQSVSNSYSLPNKFFYLPNQFWKHKNHLTVFRALKTLYNRGTPVFVVCTGYPGDYRDPMYYSDVLREVSCLGIRDQVAFLGVVPHEHVLMLMRQSICVLTPSLFEGFGMTVDEARSLGKQVMLSDIPAHREQNPPKAIFFDPTNSEELASKMEDVWRQKSPGPDKDMESEASETLPKRARTYAESFISVVKEVIRD